MTDASEDSTTNADQLRAAWSEFTSTLETLGHDAVASSPNDAERVDGLRFILRQLAYREEQFLEFPSGNKPELFDAESPTRKLFADCPDTIYHQFSVAKGGSYRIDATRGDSPYISFTAYRAAFVIIREYTHDRVNGKKATFEVTQLSPAPVHRPELSAGRLCSTLGLVGMGMAWVNDATVRLSAELRNRPNVMNEAGAELVSEMAGTPHNHYQLCYVLLQPHQALELEINPPRCRYWSVHLNNWWLESPEYRDGQSVCINDSQAHRQPDGSVKILVGPDDPGHGNWLDTKGRTETILLARYLLPEKELPPIVTTVITI